MNSPRFSIETPLQRWSVGQVSTADTGLQSWSGPNLVTEIALAEPICRRLSAGELASLVRPVNLVDQPTQAAKWDSTAIENILKETLLENLVDTYTTWPAKNTNSRDFLRGFLTAVGRSDLKPAIRGIGTWSAIRQLMKASFESMTGLPEADQRRPDYKGGQIVVKDQGLDISRFISPDNLQGDELHLFLQSIQQGQSNTRSKEIIDNFIARRIKDCYDFHLKHNLKFDIDRLDEVRQRRTNPQDVKDQDKLKAKLREMQAIKPQEFIDEFEAKDIELVKVFKDFLCQYRYETMYPYFQGLRHLATKSIKRADNLELRKPDLTYQRKREIFSPIIDKLPLKKYAEMFSALLELKAK